MDQLHKRFRVEQVKLLLQRYTEGELCRAEIEEVFGVEKTRFFLYLIPDFEKRALEVRIWWHKQMIRSLHLPLPTPQVHFWSLYQPYSKQFTFELFLTELISQIRKILIHDPARDRETTNQKAAMFLGESKAI